MTVKDEVQSILVDYACDTITLKTALQRLEPYLKDTLPTETPEPECINGEYQCKHVKEGIIAGKCIWCRLTVAEKGLAKQREMRIAAERKETPPKKKMKNRPDGFLQKEYTPQITEIGEYIAELHDYLWRFVRVHLHGASGILDDFIDEAIKKAEIMSTETPPTEIKVPEGLRAPVSSIELMDKVNEMRDCLEALVKRGG